LLGGVQPDGPKVAGGALKLEVQGPNPSEPVKVSFPVNLLALGYSTNLAPEDAALAATVVRDTQEVKSFEVLGQLKFKPRTAAAAAKSRTTKDSRGEEEYFGIIDGLIGLIPGADLRSGRVPVHNRSAADRKPPRGGQRQSRAGSASGRDWQRHW
jgi:hypothetical protein